MFRVTRHMKQKMQQKSTSNVYCNKKLIFTERIGAFIDGYKTFKLTRNTSTSTLHTQTHAIHYQYYSTVKKHSGPNHPVVFLHMQNSCTVSITSIKLSVTRLNFTKNIYQHALIHVFYICFLHFVLKT